MQKRCIKCVLPKNYPGIKFNEIGMCNYCTSYKERVYLGDEALMEKISMFLKSRGDINKDYDCILGFSGGKDSVYLLYYLNKVLGLRVFCYSADNGFIPEQTKINIMNIKNTLNVKLIIEEHDYMKKCLRHHIRSWIKKPSPPTIGMFCVGCRLGIASGMIDTSRKFKIPIIITGGTPIDSQADYKYNIMKLDLQSTRKSSFMLGYINQIIKNPYWILNPNCFAIQIKEYYTHYSINPRKRKGILKIAPFYNYIKWTENKVISTIENNLGWKKDPRITSKSRGDCDIALLKAYLYKKTLGFNDRDCEFSAMIRDRQMTREEALERLDREGDIPKDIIKEIFDNLQINYQDLEKSLREYERFKQNF